jgi:hypothetical protein
VDGSDVELTPSAVSVMMPEASLPPPQSSTKPLQQQPTQLSFLDFLGLAVRGKWQQLSEGFRKDNFRDGDDEDDGYDPWKTREDYDADAEAADVLCIELDHGTMARVELVDSEADGNAEESMSLEELYAEGDNAERRTAATDVEAGDVEEWFDVRPLNVLAGRTHPCGAFAKRLKLYIEREALERPLLNRVRRSTLATIPANEVAASCETLSFEVYWAHSMCSETVHTVCELLRSAETALRQPRNGSERPVDVAEKLAQSMRMLSELFPRAINGK